MAPTIVPENMDYMAIATKERDRIHDKMPSAILNIVSQPETPDGSTASAASSSGNDAEVTVGFQFSDLKKKLVLICTLISKPKNSGIIQRNRTQRSSTSSPPRGREISSGFEL